MTYPIKIIETPHRGKSKTWILEDEEHLAECIEFAEQSGYTDWHINEKNIIYEENEEGELIEVVSEAHTLDAYLEWLSHDLNSLRIMEV